MSTCFLIISLRPLITKSDKLLSLFPKYSLLRLLNTRLPSLLITALAVPGPRPYPPLVLDNVVPDPVAGPGERVDGRLVAIVLHAFDLLAELEALVDARLVVEELVIDRPELGVLLCAELLPLVDLCLQVLYTVLRLEHQLPQTLAELAIWQARYHLRIFGAGGLAEGLHIVVDLGQLGQLLLRLRVRRVPVLLVVSRPRGRSSVLELEVLDGGLLLLLQVEGAHLVLVHAVVHGLGPLWLPFVYL
jgi:hypothetical protein